MSASTFSVDGKTYRFFNVAAAVGKFGPQAFSDMPYTARVMAENLLRRCPAEELDASLEQVVKARDDQDIPYYPARVVMQDLTGTPALVDIAGLRDAVADSGGDPRVVNPKVPVLFVVDHSVSVDVGGSKPDAMETNMAHERRRNAERFDFLAWCKQAMANVDVVMPGNGILHQINIERLSPVVQVADGFAYPDTLVGTDSHTPMINALGVLGWGVGGIEAESVMLGRAIWMRMPEIVGVKLVGKPRPGVLATDIVLTITEKLRAEGVVESIVEFHGEGVAHLSLADRGTVSNMAPEFGATAAMFAIDQRTLDYLRQTGRSEAQIRIVEAYARAQGLWTDAVAAAKYGREVTIDLAAIERTLAGPSHPHQRVPVAMLKKSGVSQEKPAAPAPGQMPDLPVVIAAITSCTNTSNPRNMIAAGLLARKAVSLGLARKPWVKSSLAPGSRAVEAYLRAAGLIEPLAQLGFNIVAFGCTSCNGMSGPLPEEIVSEIHGRKMDAVAVLSGNRNFEGRIHPHVKQAYIASPPLVVAYAIAGSMRVDIESGAIGFDAKGKGVTLAEIWPSDAEIDTVMEDAIKPEQFRSTYDAMFRRAEGGAAKVAPRFSWDEKSTYIRRPPYWDADHLARPSFEGMRPLAILGDNITTDHMSPSGAILAESAAGKFLLEHGTPEGDFNSYGTRRGDHLVAGRATFANNRLRNEMTPGKEGSWARLEPDGKTMQLFDVAQEYLARRQPLIIVAGKNYGAGSSRDWAAKGPRLFGVTCVLAEAFERIHRSNLVGMGVVPLEFAPGTTRKTLKLDGTETFTLEGMPERPSPRMGLVMRIDRQDGSAELIPVTCRIDTMEEVEYFAHGGLLPLMHREYMQSPQPAVSPD